MTIILNLSLIHQLNLITSPYLPYLSWESTTVVGSFGSPIFAVPTWWLRLITTDLVRQAYSFSSSLAYCSQPGRRVVKGLDPTFCRGALMAILMQVLRPKEIMCMNKSENITFLVSPRVFYYFMAKRK